MAPRKATAYTVDYGRDGWRTGELFVSRSSTTPDGLDLTTPAYIIRFSREDAFELWDELARLFGFKYGGPA